MKLSSTNVNEMLLKYDFYDSSRNPEGKGFNHQYRLKKIKDDSVVLDEATGLMWQQTGSNKHMKFEDAKKWIEEINRKGIAGFNDWRLPTLEEAMSLMEPGKITIDILILFLIVSKVGFGRRTSSRALLRSGLSISTTVIAVGAASTTASNMCVRFVPDNNFKK